MKRTIDLIIGISIAAALTIGALVANNTTARGHDWYPMECCHMLDCAPVTKVEIVPPMTFAAAAGIKTKQLPTMYVTNALGLRAHVPDDLERRISPDHQMHACIVNTGEGTYTRCLWVAPGN